MSEEYKMKSALLRSLLALLLCLGLIIVKFVLKDEKNYMAFVFFLNLFFRLTFFEILLYKMKLIVIFNYISAGRLVFIIENNKHSQCKAHNECEKKADFD